MVMVDGTLVEYQKAFCVCAFYIYKEILEATVSGKNTSVCLEAREYSRAVENNWAVKGHLLRKVSRVCTLFLTKGGCIHCRVTGHDRHTKLVYM